MAGSSSIFPSSLLVLEGWTGSGIAWIAILYTWLYRLNAEIQKSLPGSHHRRAN